MYIYEMTPYPDTGCYGIASKAIVFRMLSFTRTIMECNSRLLQGQTKIDRSPCQQDAVVDQDH